MIYTRNHGIREERWIEMKETNFYGGDSTFDEEAGMHENIKLSREIWGDKVNMLIPIIDLPNHHTPRHFNASDYIRFGLSLDIR